MLIKEDGDIRKADIDKKDKKITYKGLSYKLVKDTWPDLLPDVEEETTKTKKEEVVEG